MNVVTRKEIRAERDDHRGRTGETLSLKQAERQAAAKKIAWTVQLAARCATYAADTFKSMELRRQANILYCAAAIIHRERFRIDDEHTEAAVDALAEARRDGERLDWLGKTSYDKSLEIWGRKHKEPNVVTLNCHSSGPPSFAGTSLRSAIDSAMLASGKGEGK